MNHLIFTSPIAKKGKIHGKETKSKQSKFHLMLRKKLVQERRENAEKKKSADQGTEPDNRITQNVLPQEAPIFASPPAYQDIYSKVPMPAMLPLPVFYYDSQESSGNGPDVEESEGADIPQGFYLDPEVVDDQVGSGELASDENALENAEKLAEQTAAQYNLPNEDENGNLLDREEKGQAYTDSESGNAAKDIYEDAKNIEQGEGVNAGEKTESEAVNRDDMAANGAAAPQGGDNQAGAKPAAGQEAAGQEPAGQQPAGQQPPQPAKEEDKG